MTDRRQLIECLHNEVADDLEQAAARAGDAGHEDVRIEHLLSALLDHQRNPALTELLASAGLPLERVVARLGERLAVLPAHPGVKPVMDEALMRWLEQGLITANLHYGGKTITATALIEALSTMAPRLADYDIFREIAGLDTTRLRPLDPQSEGAVDTPDPGEQTLAQYTIDFTARARSGELDPVLGRNTEIRAVIDALGRRNKSNPLLVGEPGVGKTALVEGLALRIEAGQVPAALEGVRVLGLDLGLLQAGASVKGEFEKRVRDILDAVKTAAEPVVLFIDEAHMLIGAGGDAGGSDAANLLKPALARGELRCIAATTFSEYKRHIERDAALARRFQLITVPEPDEASAQRMLAGLRERLEAHHAITITEAGVESAVRLAARYVPGRQLPDKAVDLLDTAASRVRLARAAPPQSLDAARETVTYLENRRQRVDAEVATGLSESAAERQRIDDALANARDERQVIEDQWQRERALCDDLDTNADAERRAALAEAHSDGGYVHAEVTPAAIADVVADWTGVPMGHMLEDDINTVLALEDELAQGVVGQNTALQRLGHSLRSAKAGLRRDDAPMAVYLLTGPSGVGKTETARRLAERLFGSDDALISIAMSEYQESHSVAQLKGAPPGYVGYGEGGVLTEAVRRRPYACLLLDEVEKAHRDILDLFYQIFDQGSARDGEGREVDFRNTLILMTSNLGTDALTGPEGGPRDDIDPVSAVEPSLQAHFGSALLARTEIVPFQPLDEAALGRIAALKLDALAQRLHRAHGITCDCSEDVVSELARRCQASDSGARRVEGLIEQQLMPGLAKALLQYQAAGDMPAVARLEIAEEGGFSCVFADWDDASATA
jgi:type VI secretion system protein VasG